MKRHRSLLFFTAIILCFVLLLVILFQRENAPVTVSSANFSIVVYGTSSDRWRAFDQGVSQACTELALVKPSLILPAREESADSQLVLLKREVANGAQGLIVAATDSARVAEYLGGLPQALPVVLVETPAGAHSAISADDKAMGAALADALADRGFDSILAARTGFARESTRHRYEGFVQRAAELGLPVFEWELGEVFNPQDLAAYRGDGQSLALVGFDNESLETLSLAELLGVRIFGVGSSDTIVTAIDNGRIDTVCFPNEFNMGYLSVMELVSQMGLQAAPPDAGVDFELVNRQNLYTPEIERLVFPLTQ